VVDKFVGLYAELYDSFHEKKNYRIEVEQFLNILETGYFHSLLSEKSFFDFGCGTGSHISVLRSLGYRVSGYDVSDDMLRIAAQRNPIEVTFFNVIPSNLKFDVVYSLFDVSSYQLTDEDFTQYLDQLDSLVAPRGVLVFDGWHLSGVLLSPPENRSKIISAGEFEIERRVSVKSSSSAEISELTIELIGTKENNLLIREIHNMRSFNLSYIVAQLELRGFANIQFFDASDFRADVTSRTWRFLVFASRAN